MGVLTLLYGVINYFIFFITFLYAIGFVSNLVVPKSIDTGLTVPLAEALIVNVLLLGLFAVQHSVMARPGFKRWWTKIVPQPAERSTYVLFASAALLLLYWQWRPITEVVWSVENATGIRVLNTIFWLGWALLLVSTFPDQPLRAIRFAAGVRATVESHFAGRHIQDAARLSSRAPSDLSRLHHRVLGGADDDGRALAVLDRDDGICPDRHLFRRARLDRSVWRPISSLSPTGRDAAAVARQEGSKPSERDPTEKRVLNAAGLPPRCARQHPVSDGVCRKVDVALMCPSAC